MTFTNAGNVGIGNTTPWEKLNIGNCSVTNSNGARDVSASVEERPGFFHSFAQQGSLFHRLGWSITYSTQFKTLLVRNKTAKTPTHSSTPNPRFPAHA